MKKGNQRSRKLARKSIKVPKIDRPPLTTKAKAAISLYVELKAEYPTLQSVIAFTLKADRMSRKKLYSYLSYRNYIWDSKVQIWRKKHR